MTPSLPQGGCNPRGQAPLTPFFDWIFTKSPEYDQRPCSTGRASGGAASTRGPIVINTLPIRFSTEQENQQIKPGIFGSHHLRPREKVSGQQSNIPVFSLCPDFPAGYSYKMPIDPSPTTRVIQVKVSTFSQAER